RTSALTGKQINVKATNSIRDMACSATTPNQHIRPITSAYQVQPTRAKDLLDHLVGAGEQRERDVQLRAERVDRGQRGHIATVHYISLPCSHQKPISISRYIVVAAVKFSWACSGLPARR